jgi:hypothetical protein
MRPQARPPISIVLLLLAAVALLAAPALARAGLFNGLRSSATTQRGGFHGTLSVRRFELQRGRLAARVVLRGTVRDARYPQDVTFHQPAEVAVHLGGHGCRVTVSIGPAQTFVWGLPATLHASHVTVSGSAGCGLRSARGASAQAAALDRLRRARG